MANSIVKKLMAGGNAVASALYRRSNGRIGGKVKGLPVLLLTVPGRKTGIPRTAPVAYFDYEGGYLVAGSAAGAKDDPQWFRNLAATERAHVQLGTVQADVTVHIAEGEEREQIWRDVVLARGPFFAKYEEKSGRTIPLALLSPTV